MIFSIHSDKSYKITFVFIGIFIALLIAISGYQENSFLHLFDNKIYDFFIVKTASPPKKDTVVIVDIDDISLDMAGQWPWPRYRIAKLIDRISAANPEAIGIDIIFSEPDRTSLANIRQTFQTEFGMDLHYTGIPPGLTDNDSFLGHILSKAPATGATVFYFDHTSIDNIDIGKGLDLSIKEKELLSPHKATGVLSNIPEIAKGLSSRGFINSRNDDDGTFRKFPLLIDFQGSFFPNIALATYIQANNISDIHISEDFTGPVIHLGQAAIPVDRQGYVYLKFNGQGKTHSYISAVDILNGKDITDIIAGKIVFIGSSATAMNDTHHTAIYSQFPGVEMHAVLIDNIINKNFIRIPSWSLHLSIFLVFVSSVLVTAMFLTSNLLLIIFGSLLLGLAFFLASYFLFSLYGIFISPSGPLLSIIVLFSLLAALKYTMERKLAFTWYKQLANVQQVSLLAMASVAETRDPDTGAHINRTQYYSKILATNLQKKKKYASVITDEYLEMLFLSAPLHDIGKVGVPDHILLKPGPLTNEEFSIMKKHTIYGYTIIENSAKKIKGKNFLTLAGEIAISHHERWNGSGYPNGLSKEDIPLSGRILAVADVYDALVSVRCYKPAFSHEEALRILKDESGTHFDPDVIEAFCDSEQDIKDIVTRFSDDEYERNIPD